MRKRDELNDPESCLNRARDDEQTFVLLGRDAAADELIDRIYTDMSNSWILGLTKMAVRKCSLDSVGHIRGTDIPLDTTIAPSPAGGEKP